MIKRKMTFNRTITEEVTLELEFPDTFSEIDILHDSRIQASKSDGWETIIIDRPDLVEKTWAEWVEMCKIEMNKYHS